MPTCTERDNFFALGGESMSALAILGRIHAQWGVQLRLRDVFDRPSPAELAAQVANVRVSIPTTSGAPAAPQSWRPRTEPLAPGQESFWKVARVLPEAPMFIQLLRIDAIGAVDPRELHSALRGVAARHDALRATFADSARGPVRRIHPVVALPFTWHRYLGLSGADRERAIGRICRVEARTPFALAALPPIRARLISFANEDHVLLVSTHHIAADGWSRHVLISDLAACYAARISGAPPAPQPPSFTEVARRWQARISDGGLAQATEHARATLGPPYAPMRLPGGRDPVARRYRSAVRPLALPPELGQAAVAVARTQRSTAFTVLLAAYMATLAQECRAPEARVAVQVANREWTETQQVIGPLANTVVVRAPVAPQAGTRALLATVRTAILEAYRHQDVPFEMVLKVLRRQGAVSPADLLQVGFALHEAPSGGIDVPGGRLCPAPIPELDAGGVDPTTFELVLELWPAGHGFRGELTYDTDVYSAGTVEAFVARYLDTVRGMVCGRDPDLGSDVPAGTTAA